MLKKKVSVVIPVYQVSDCVERCITSVMAQTYQDIECILVDDATKDDSIDKCERLIAEYSGRIKFEILHHEENKGLSAARNTGIKVATGDFVFFLDSDDEITSECIENLMTLAQKYPDAEIVVGNTLVVKDGSPERVWIKEETPELICPNETIVDYYHKRAIPNAAWNKLIKRSFIEKHSLYFEEGIIHEDILWMFYVVKYLPVVALVKEVTSFYHIRRGSISTSTDEYTEGRDYGFIYGDMLHHLTSGRENKELNRYVNDFCKCYLKHKAMIPAYKDLHRRYAKSAWRYGCWYVYMVLIIVAVISRLGNPMGILKRINMVRRLMKGKRINYSKNCNLKIYNYVCSLSLA